MKLVFFLPLGQSLANQKKSGQYDRFEKYYLQKYREVFNKVYLVSYAEKDLEPEGVKVLLNKFNFHRYLWAFLIPFVYKNELKNSIYRVMQLDGLIPALISKYLNGGKVVVTYGYDYPSFARLEKKYLQTSFYIILEKFFLPFADTIFVPNKEVYESFKKDPRLKKKIIYHPNGVDAKSFKSGRKVKRSNKLEILSQGRLEKQKNLAFLFTEIASKNLNSLVKVTIIGKGSQRTELEMLAKKLQIEAQFIESVSNNKMPDYYNSCDIYIQTSFIEGSPKSILEAMACGCCVLASRVPGTREIIVDGYNGLLFDLTSGFLAAKILLIKDNTDLQKKLGIQARKTILKNHDINKVLQKEISAILS